MAIQVAKTTYETTPDKKLAAVDVYAKDITSQPINSETSIPDSLKGSYPENYMPNSLNKLYTDFNKDFKDPTKSLSQALDVLNGVVKNPKEFTKSLSKEILGDTLRSVGYKGTSDDIVNYIKDGPNSTNVLNILGNSNADLKVIIGDVEKMVANKDLSTVNGISSLIGELTGNSNLLKILDISPKISVVKGFIDQAMKLRLPEAVDLLVDAIDNDDDKRDLKLYSTLNAAYNSDLDFINTQINDATIGVGAITGIYPTITSTILSNYILTNKVPSSTEAAKLISTLNSLDSKWMTYTRNGKTINSVSDMASATEDAIEVLLKDERTYIMATLARQLDTKNMVEVTLAMRPYTPAAVLTTK